MRQPPCGISGTSDSNGLAAAETWPQTDLPHTSEDRPPATVARNSPRPTFRGAGWVGSVIYMCAMPANSLPRSSPGWPFVSTQTQYEAGFDSIMSSVFVATASQPFAV